MENEEYYNAAQRVKQFIKDNNYHNSVDKKIITEKLIEFREAFSPSKLQELPDDELLNIIPLGKGEQNNLCHALEFKYNEYFGSIRGGAAFKFGLFWSTSREKWMTGSNKRPNELTEEEANNLCKEFRDSIVKVANLIENIKPDSVEKYVELEKNIMQMLPQQLCNAMWIHKYFSMIYPEYFSNFHSRKWQETILNRLGIEPKETQYVRSGQIVMVEKLTGLFRGEFSEVLYDMLNEKVDDVVGNVNNFDKNIILYGPPGTGKTYNSVRYAVAICDNLTLDEVDNWTYADVMKRYNELKNADRINFVTFHQSYGYEEFIEGIKPIIDDESNEVRYSVESGIFKDFCQKAVKPDNDNIDLSAKIWLVRLNGNGKNDLKTFCFNNNVVRFNWNDDDAKIYKTSMEKIKVGDYVISYCEQSRFVDGIGIVSSDELKFAKEYDSFNWQRDVKWLATNIMEDVKPINDDKWLGNFEISSTKIQVLDLLRIVRKYNDSISKDNNKPCIFIIDEINRGNISKIFGELITLIEDTKRAGMSEEASVELPYSHKSFSVPSNVYILGTMNTADRSIAMMDTALRRRFNFIEMMPKSGELEGIEVEGVNIKKLLDAMNNRIEVLYDREHTLGHAFFMRLDSDSTINDLKNIFKNKIIPLLQEYFYEDYEKIQLVLGDNAKEDEFKFILDKKIDITSIFKGNPNEVLDDDAKQYVINDDAFDRVESYQQIY